MDIPRVAIWLGLAIVAYLLVLAWNEDYHQDPEPREPVVEQPAEAPDEPVMEAPESPEVPREAEPPTDEFTVPEDEDAVAQERDPETPMETPARDAETIRVRTDVLDLDISLKGGSITRADFPQHKRTLESDEPLRLLRNDQERTYILESSLIGRDGPYGSARGGPPVYQAEQNRYELAEGQDSLTVDLYHETDQGIPIIKRYHFGRDEYRAEVSYHIRNTSNEPWVGNFSGKIVRDESDDPTGQRILGVRASLGMVLNTPDDAYTKYDFGDLTDSPLNKPVEGGWLAFLQHYFMTAWIPPADQQHQYQTVRRGHLHVMGFVNRNATRVEPGEEKQVGATFYVGPKVIERLKEIAPNLERTVDFGWLFFISLPLFYILDWFYGLVGNWGVAIILLTVVVKGVFYKLSATSYRSMANMRRVAPQLQRLRDLHGDDKQKLSQEMMNLYKKEKINPLGGCLPILVQMPVFIALYWVLFESVELRHAPFFLWIDDLSVMDPYFILPILMGASMFLQMQLNPAPPDPIQAKVMKAMPIMFTFFFLWFPAGLVLYWLSNNVLSMAQQFYIYRQIDNEQGKVSKK